jgi:DNA-binding transcriptional ArsR family regulator
VQTYHRQSVEAFSDPTRQALLERLRRGPTTVGELASHFPVSRPAISQHLRVLKQARLVKDRAEGTRRYYQLDQRGFDSLRAYFNTFWGDALEAFKSKVEEK